MMEPHDIVTDDDLVRALTIIGDLRSQTLKLLHLQESAIIDLRAQGHEALNPGTSTPTEAEKRMAVEQADLMCRASELRGVYRQTTMSTRMTKDTTSNARAEVDGLHLQLQNLVYEHKHFKGEISACEGYKHKYTNLPLINIEEFLQLFPAKSDLSEHDLTIARIEHEYTERQSLEETRQGLLKQKQGLIAENNKRKDDLANLDKDLEKFIHAASPILKTLQKQYN